MMAFTHQASPAVARLNAHEDAIAGTNRGAVSSIQRYGVQMKLMFMIVLTMPIATAFFCLV